MENIIFYFLCKHVHFQLGPMNRILFQSIDYNSIQQIKQLAIQKPTYYWPNHKIWQVYGTYSYFLLFLQGAVMVMIAQWLDLQLPV
jgi:hypothetical protein